MSHFSQEKFDEFVERQLSNLPTHKKVNIKQSKPYNYFIFVAPSVADIDPCMKKDILNLLGKVPVVAPAELPPDSKVSYSYGYTSFLSNKPFFNRSLEWEIIKFDARNIQSLLMEHPRARRISGFYSCFLNCN